MSWWAPALIVLGWAGALLAGYRWGRADGEARIATISKDLSALLVEIKSFANDNGTFDSDDIGKTPECIALRTDGTHKERP